MSNTAIAAETRPVWNAAEDARRMDAMGDEGRAAMAAAFRAIGRDDVAAIFEAGVI